MTNDTDLCSNDDFWKEISCDLHKPDTNYLGKGALVAQLEQATTASIPRPRGHLIIL